jgi:hypothetical protein
MNAVSRATRSTPVLAGQRCFAIGRVLFAVVGLSAWGSAAAQDDLTVAQRLPGVWTMAPREYHGEHFVTYWKEATLTIHQPLPDGRFPIMTRTYKTLVANSEGLLNIPGCEDQKECSFDEATEGIGSSFRSAFYVDYFADGWIDDLFTVKGNVMTADDGNGPIVFTKFKTLDGELVPESWRPVQN